MSERRKPTVEYGSQLPASELKQLDAVVILPTLNEEEGLAKTYPTIPLAEIRRGGLNVGVVVIDGGSTDRTLDVARGLGLTILHQATKGKGSAVREALEWVGLQGVPYALMMDADCTYPSEMIGPSLSLLKAGGQLVVGVRNPINVKPIGARDIVHRVGNTLLNWLATQTTGHSILDLCSGFYAIDLRTGVHENLSATGFEIEAEMFLKAYRSGLRVLQIPINYKERVGMAKLRAVHDGGRIFVTILRAARIPTVRPLEAPVGAGPLVRELLSACFVHGSRELVVLAHPSRLREANRLVEELKGSQFEHTLVVPEPESLLGGPNGSLERPVAGAWPGVAVLHLAAQGATSPTGASPMVMYLPNTRRLIRLDFDPPTLAQVSAAPAEPVVGSARSGAQRVPSRTARYLNSLTTLGSSLDSSGFEKEMILHGANGLKGTAVRPREIELPPTRLGLIPDEDRSTGRTLS